MTAQVIAVVNQKGGVGKTTTVFHLARAAALKGRKVLLVDLDPQGSLTLIAAGEGEVEPGQVGLADVLTKRSNDTMADVIVDTVWTNVSLIPTTGESLGEVRDELVVSGAGREMRLRNALAPMLEDYDLILLDCPPSLDQLTVNALTAANSVLIVSESKLLSAAGIKKILDTIEVIRASYRPELKIAGIILNKHEAKTTSGKYWKKEIEVAHPILEPPLPKSAMISDAAEHSTGLDQGGYGRRGSAIGDIFHSYIRQIEKVNA